MLVGQRDWSFLRMTSVPAHGDPGEVLTSFDWSQTALGPERAWPQEMRSIVEACDASPVPMISVWGPDGLAVHNQAFADVMGERHTALLGASILKTWPDGIMARRVLDVGARRQASMIRISAAVFADDGLDPRREFDLGCSPIGRQGGPVSGVLCVLSEASPRLDAPPSRDDRSRSRQSLLLKVADDFRSAPQREGVLAMALHAIGQEVGAASAGHAEIDVAHDEATFDAGPTVEGARQTGSVAIDHLAPGRGADLRSGHSVVVDLPGSTAAHDRDQDAGMTSRLLVPLVREGRLRSLFIIELTGWQSWTADDVSLVEDIASRAWEAIERIQAAATLRRNQARQGFLLVLGDRLREFEDPDEIMETTAESLGRHLKVNRAGYGEVSAKGELLFRTGWSDGSVPPVVGEFKLVHLGQDQVLDLGRGLTATFESDDTAQSEPIAMVRDLRTAMAVPLIRDGKLKGLLFIGSGVDRHWLAEDIALVGEVAARLWEALERARAEAALHDLNATLENRVVQRTHELTKSEARFRTLFVNAPAPIFLIRVSSEGEVAYDAVNAATVRFMGGSTRDMVGQPVSQRTSTGEALRDHCLRSAQTGQPVEYQISIETNGSWRTAECVLAPLPIEDDDTQLLIGIARDITAQRQVEEQLRQAQKMEAIGQLTGGIAHDFNNLLTGIIGSLALMEKRLAQGKTEAITRYLGLAMTSANRAAALTHRLLAFSRRQPLEAKSVNVSSLVISMDDLLRRTLGESVVLETVGSDETWLTMCDPHQLENALLNLAINARDAMPDGGRLLLETSNVTADALLSMRETGVMPGDYVVLSVTDTGIGMPQDVIARAFDPFFTTKPIGQGTGLGLSMIYGFARQSDGHVKIYSEVDVGTTVKIFLPRHRGEGEIPVDDAVSVAPRAETGECVLVVEDDDTVRSLVLETLRDLGYMAMEAVDGPSGLAAVLSDKRIDLMVTDVGLPGMNGRQLAEQARAHRPELNVLFITGYAENAAFGAGHLESGMQMMTKPFTGDELATRIRSILQIGGSSMPLLPDDR